VGKLQPAGPKRQAGGALGTPLCTRDAWAACLGARYIPAPTWRLA